MSRNIRMVLAGAWAALILFIFAAPVSGAVYLATLTGVKGPSMGFANGDLSGTYRFRMLEFEDFGTAGQEAFVGKGTITFNGVGAWTGSLESYGSDGWIDTETIDGSYSVNPDGSFTFTVYDAAPGHVFSGTLSKDAGRSFFYMTLGADLSEFVMQSIVVALKERATAPTLSSLNGVYTFRNLAVTSFGTVTPDAQVTSAAITCDGAGNWTANFTSYNAWARSETGTVMGTYAVNGKSFDFRVSGEPGLFMTADLSGDGNLLVLGSSSDLLADGEQWVGTMVKRNPAVPFSDASLNGTYKIGMLLLQDFAGSSPEAYVIDSSVTFNGAGTFVSAFDGVSSSGTPFSGAGSGVYSVDTDGSFILTVTSETPNLNYTGTISLDGHVFTGTRADGGFDIPGKLFLDLGPPGLYAFDGYELEPVITADVQGMAAVDGGIAVGLPGYGVYLYDGSDWTHVSAAIPEGMLFWSETLVMNFGVYGVWAYTGSGWIPIHSASPDCMAVWGDLLVLSFNGYGVYGFDGYLWTSIVGVAAEKMLAWGPQLVMDLGVWGVYAYEPANLIQLHPTSPQDMTVWGGDLLLYFESWGVWAYNGSSWTLLPVGNPEAILGWGDSLVLDYGSGGLYRYDSVSWQLITAMIPEDMEVAEFDD